MKTLKDHIRDYEFSNSLTFNMYLSAVGNDYKKAKALCLQDKEYIRRLKVIEELK